MKTIYLDAETIPSPTMPAMEDVKIDARLKDLAKIEAAKQGGQEKQYRGESLQFLKGRILCLCYAVNDEKPIVLTGTEKEIITQFSEMVVNLGGDLFSYNYVGHNILFDLKFIVNKARLFGLKKLSRILPTDRYDDRIKDTMKAFVLGDYKDFVSLKDMALFFGIDCKNELDGSKVYDYWKEDRLQEIYNYCQQDVEVVRDIHINYFI